MMRTDILEIIILCATFTSLLSIVLYCANCFN